MGDAASELASSLDSIRRYLRELASYQRRDQLARILSDPEQRRAYELSDGERNSELIADDAEISKSARTIRRWWKDWTDRGLLDESFGDHPRRRYETFVLDQEDG